MFEWKIGVLFVIHASINIWYEELIKNLLNRFSFVRSVLTTFGNRNGRIYVLFVVYLLSTGSGKQSGGIHTDR